MIEMTSEIKKQLLDLGRDAVDNSKTDVEILRKLIRNSQEVVTNKIGIRELPECNLSYHGTANPELLLWSVGLISICWTLYLLKRKAIEGNCHTHKKQTGLPCPKGQKFHDELFHEAKRSFEELIVRHDYDKDVRSDLEIG